MAEDWDLWAVVRSCCTPSTTIAATSAAQKLIPVVSHTLAAVGDNSFGRTYKGFEELEQVIKPYDSSSSRVFSHHRDQGNQPQFSADSKRTRSPSRSAVDAQSSHQNPKQQLPPREVTCKYERERKKNHRKWVIEVDADKLPEIDQWNWRKYGRKPIKASPYPRNYYKCSSEDSKCRAKKYVEKCGEHPEKLIVSYSGEHNHVPPSRRSALSCSTRKKPHTATKDCFPSSSSSAAAMPPPSYWHGNLMGMEDVGGDIENFCMGLEELVGGHVPSSGEVQGFDGSWNPNSDFMY